MCLGSRWHRSKIKTSHCAIGLPSSDICFSMIPCFTNSAPSKSWKYINMWISEFIALQTVSCGPCGPKSSGRMNWSQVVKQWASEKESVKKTREAAYPAPLVERICHLMLWSAPLSLSYQMWAGSVVPGWCLLWKFPSCLAIRSLTVKCIYSVKC